VVADARKALAKGDPAPVLIWVRAADEPAVREAFARAMEVRKAGGTAQSLADQFFFETVVRLHRAGEGAPYTGLKPVGRNLGPVVPAGDRALQDGDLKPVWKLLSDAAHQGLHARFEAARRARLFAPGDLAAGRRFVAAYVDYMHFLEGMQQAAGSPDTGAAAPSSHTHH
jgi:hypothetical protein